MSERNSVRGMDFFGLVASFIAGLLAGLTGALPFLHTNNVLAFFSKSVSSFSGSGFGFAEPLAASVFAVALSFSHLAFETIPALFLALPAQNQSIAALPGQRLVLEGKAEAALLLIARSLLLALVASVALAPLAIVLLPLAFAAAKPFAGVVLCGVILLSLSREGDWRRAAAGAGVFALSGAVGFVALSLPVAREPLFPLLAGLFGVPALLFSFGAKPPSLKTNSSNSSKSSNTSWRFKLRPVDWRLILAGVGVGAGSVLFPALSPALLCGALFVFLEGDAEAFLEASSAVVAAKMFFDFTAVYVIGKARSGAAAFVLEAFHSSASGVSGASGVAQSASLSDFALAAVAALAALAAALALLVVFRARFAAFFSRIAGNVFSASLLALVVVGSFVFSGFGGLLVLAAAASAGCVAPLLNLKRSYGMGALFVPSILYSFGLAAVVAQLFY